MVIRAPRMVLILTAGAALAAGLAGCTGPGDSKGGGGKKEAAEHEHAHVHHGPHNGHLMEIGEEEYHAEWTDDESGKVTFYFLDAEAKKEVPVDAAEISIEVRIGAKEPTTYKLAAVEPKDGKASAFEIVDKNLQGVLAALSAGVTATFPKLTIGGKTFENLKIEEHKHEEEEHKK
jgi:hypothetical protein